MKLLKRKSVKIILSILISLLFLYLAIRQIDFQAAWDHIQDANLALLALGLVIWLFGYVVRMWRWQIFLAPFSKVRSLDAFRAVMAGFAVNNTFPFRAGELFRAYVLNKMDKKVPVSAGFATIIGDRIFDGLSVVILTIVGATALNTPLWAKRAMIASSILFVVVFLIFFILVGSTKKRERFFVFVRRIFHFKIFTKIFDLTESFIDGLTAMSSISTVIKIFITSLIIWLIEASFYYLSALSFGIEISFIQSCFLMGILNLGVMIPAAPGGIGTFEFITVESLKLIGVSSSLAFGYGVVSHVLQNGSVIIIGFLSLLHLGITVSDIEKIEDKKVNDVRMTT